MLASLFIVASVCLWVCGCFMTVMIWSLLQSIKFVVYKSSSLFCRIVRSLNFPCCCADALRANFMVDAWRANLKIIILLLLIPGCLVFNMYQLTLFLFFILATFFFVTKQTEEIETNIKNHFNTVIQNLQQSSAHLPTTDFSTLLPYITSITDYQKHSFEFNRIDSDITHRKLSENLQAIGDCQSFIIQTMIDRSPTDLTESVSELEDSFTEFEKNTVYGTTPCSDIPDCFSLNI